jgi:hypothetical protein
MSKKFKKNFSNFLSARKHLTKSITTLTNHLWKPLVMETHNHVMETHNPLMETHYHLWKPFLKNKELSFMETLFEKQGMCE